jgi:hypothetical protein
LSLVTRLLSLLYFYYGQGGIRTRDTLLRYTRSPGVRLQPLGHLSGVIGGGQVSRFAAPESTHGDTRSLFSSVRSARGQRQDTRGLRGVPGDRQPLGPPPALPQLRACRLLRLLARPPRQRAFPPHRPPRDPLIRARRGMAVVLRGRDLSGRLSRPSRSGISGRAPRRTREPPDPIAPRPPGTLP